MGTSRRGFLGGVIGGALAGLTKAKTVENQSPSLELILNDPNLFHFRANEGHSGFIWLNNVEQSEHITEWVCSPHKGESVLGAIRKPVLDSRGIISTDSGGLIQEWIIGTVRWEPRHPTIELPHDMDYESSQAY